MSGKSSNSLPNSLSDFLSKLSGKIVVVVSFVTAIIALVNLIRGDFRLAAIILLLVSAGTPWLVSVYVYFKKNENRQSTVKSGTAVVTKPAYSPRVRSVALASIIAIPIFCAFGIVYSKKTSHGTRVRIVDLITSERITLAGTVLTAGGEPADNAVVTLRLKDSDQTQVADNGRFRFTQVDIGQETSKTVGLKFRWRDIEETQLVDLSAGSQDDLVFRLPAGAPPFKLEYRVFGGYAIDFLVKGEIDKQWEKILGEQPYIVVNDVFKNLQAIQTSFSEPFQGWYFLINPNRKYREKVRADTELAKRNQKRPFLPLYKDEFSSPVVSYNPSKEEFLSVFTPAKGWNVSFSPSKWTSTVELEYLSDRARAFYFWKPADADDLKSFRSRDPRNQALAFYSFVSRSYLPARFIFLAMIVGEEMCGQGNALWLVAPEPQLRVALIENISEHPIRIGNFSLKENDPNRLRTREEDQTALKTSTAKPKDMFPLQYLKPKERLLIPLELLLTYRDEDFPPRKESGDQDLGELTKSPIVKFPIYTKGFTRYSNVEVKTSELVKLMRRSQEPPKLGQDFVYGPTITIDNLEVDGVNYPFRPLNTSSLVLTSGGGEAGSCPYIYTHSAESDLWVDEGTILYRMKGKMNEATEQKRLNRFDGKIMIREKDPETSFIDSVVIIVTTVNGEERLLYPRNQRLQFDDGRYMTLRQGDQLVIEFEVPQGVSARTYVLRAKGYYLPY